MYLEIGLLIFAAAMLLLVLFCIPILIKLWRAVSDVTVSVQTLNQHLPIILKNMEEISTHANHSMTVINDEVQKYKETSAHFHTIMDHMVDGMAVLSPYVVHSPVFRKMTDAIAVLKGLRVFINVLTGKK